MNLAEWSFVLFFWLHLASFLLAVLITVLRPRRPNCRPHCRHCRHWETDNDAARHSLVAGWIPVLSSARLIGDASAADGALAEAVAIADALSVLPDSDLGKAIAELTVIVQPVSTETRT